MEKKLYRREKGSEWGVFSNSAGPLEKVKFQQIGKAVKVLRGAYQGEKTVLEKVQRLKRAMHLKKGRIVGGELGSNVGNLKHIGFYHEWNGQLQDSKQRGGIIWLLLKR